MRICRRIRGVDLYTKYTKNQTHFGIKRQWSRYTIFKVNRTGRPIHLKIQEANDNIKVNINILYIFFNYS